MVLEEVIRTLMNGINALIAEAPETSLVVQWLRLRAPSKRSRGSIPGQGTRVPQAPSPPKRGLGDIIGPLHRVKTQ